VKADQLFGMLNADVDAAKALALAIARLIKDSGVSSETAYLSVISAEMALSGGAQGRELENINKISMVCTVVRAEMLSAETEIPVIVRNPITPGKS
jgi:hypothetical protein